MAVERVIGGLEKKRIVSESERKTVALHESGHGVVSWFLEGGLPLLKLTIIPRSKGALGFAQYLPNESQLERKKDLVDRLCSILGGRIAEEVIVGKVRLLKLSSLYRLAMELEMTSTKSMISLIKLSPSSAWTPTTVLSSSRRTSRVIKVTVKRLIK